MRRVIILEGADGAGKSTLAKRFERELPSDSLPVRVHHHGSYQGEDEIWTRYLFSMLPAYANLCTVVLDRSWLSEPIYGAAYRSGANRIEAWQRRMLERVALGRGAVVVWCAPPFAACVRAFEARRGAEMLESTAQLRAVYDLYAEAATAPVAAAVASLRYSYRGGARALSNLFDKLEIAGKASNRGPGIGAWRPGEVALIVGERPGRANGSWHLPFVSLSRTGCSAWLAEQLEAAGIGERDLYWVNAFHETSSYSAELDPGFVERLRPRATFALGTTAAAWCERHLEKAAWHRFDHPQYHKRFHHHQPYPLLEELKACLTH